MIFPFCDAPNAASIICCHIIESDHPFYMSLMMKMMGCGSFCAVQHMKQKKQE